MMGAKERRERERDQVRTKVLDAAQQLIVDEGFAQLSMRKLATAVEYSPAFLYKLFASRDDIAQQLAERAFSHLLSAMESRAETADRQPVERLAAILAAYIEWGLANPQSYRLIFLADAAYAQTAFQIAGEERASRRALRLLVDACAAAAASPPSGPDELAECLWSAVHGFVSLQITCRSFSGAGPQQAAETLIRGVLRGFFAAPELSRDERAVSSS